jgi:pimeloyl-ACP methyl ester carboxylesterase
MKAIRRIAAALLLFLLIAAALFYYYPLQANDDLTRYHLWRSNVRSEYVDAGPYRLHYFEALPPDGSPGIPLLLIHGLGAHSEDWAAMIPSLSAAGFHVYAPDLLGAGRSPKPANGDYSIAGEEKFVVDFIQSLGLPQTDVGGWSMGGWIALKLALDHPDLVNRVVVYDSAGIVAGSSPLPPGVFHPQTPADLQRLFSLMEPEARPLSNNVAREGMQRMQASQWVIDKQIAAMVPGTTLDSQIPHLTEPLLIVWGADDHLTPLAMGQALHAMDPKSELDIVDGCGHLAPKFCSARVAAATADFLKANPVPAGQVRTLTSMGR